MQARIIHTTHHSQPITLLVEDGQVVQCWPSLPAAIGAIHQVRFEQYSSAFRLAQAVLDTGERISVKLPFGQKINAGDWGLVTITAHPFEDKLAQAIARVEIAGRYILFRQTHQNGIHIRSSKKKQDSARADAEILYPELMRRAEQLTALGEHIEIVLRRSALRLAHPGAILQEADLLIQHFNAQVSSVQHFTQKGEIFSGFDALDLARLEAPDAAITSADAVEIQDYFSQIDRFLQRQIIVQNGAVLWVEPTRAGLMIDIDGGTSGLNGPALSASVLPYLFKMLRLRSRGGRILIDFPLTSPAQRQQLTAQINAVASNDSKITELHGFTASGLFELVRRHSITPLEQWWISA